MTTQIVLDLTSKQAESIVIAADCFGVTPSEMAVHVLSFRQRLELQRQIEKGGSDGNR